jgi:capsular polysaccharide transport system permease protein
LENASNTSAPLPQDAAPKKLISRLKNINRLFAVAVLAPTALAIVYYGLIASDVYVSESRFIVRSTKQQPQLSMVGALLAGGGASQADENSYPVIDYIESRDALRELNKENYIARVYSQGGDFISRFHDHLTPSFESLWRYYGKRVVKISSDPISGIAILQVRAYTASDAAKINAELVRLSEQLVNRMNERAASDTVDFAQREVETAALKVKSTATALAAYRNTHAIFDPERQSSLRLQQIAALQTDLFSAQSQLAQLYALSPQNPQIPALKTAIASLQKQIEETSRTVTGGENSLSQKATEYQRLELDSDFAQKQLASTMTSYEAAREEAARKQLYLEELVQPNTPDIAIEPKRIRSIATVFALGVVFWGVLSLLFASIKEHRD